MHHDLGPVDQVLHTEMLDQGVPHHNYQVFMALGDEQRCLASDAVTYEHYQKSRLASKQRIAKERGLVVVRNHAVDSQKGENWRADGLGRASWFLTPHLAYRSKSESFKDLGRQRGITQMAYSCKTLGTVSG